MELEKNIHRQRALRRGDIVCIKMPEGSLGSEQTSYSQSKSRPAVVVQNDIGNYHSNTTVVAFLTSHKSNLLPTHVVLVNPNYNITVGTVVLCEQIMTVDKARIVKYLNPLTESDMERVDNALACSLGLKWKQ